MSRCAAAKPVHGCQEALKKGELRIVCPLQTLQMLQPPFYHGSKLDMARPIAPLHHVALEPKQDTNNSVSTMYEKLPISIGPSELSKPVHSRVSVAQ